jgi:hypothetical protein
VLAEEGHQVLPISHACEDDHLRSGREHLEQLPLDPRRPGQAIGLPHGVEGSLVRGDLLIRVQQPVLGGEDVLGVCVRLCVLAQPTEECRGIEIRRAGG